MVKPPDRDRLRYLWLGLGTVMSLFAVGGLWDFAAAAWLFPIFLLRFTRISRPFEGIGVVWLVCIAGPALWMWELAVPLRASSVLGSAAYGTIFTLPFLLDRLLGPRLGTITRLLQFPAALAACEFLMGEFSPLGTAYGLLAFTQHRYLPLLQLISITGPYAIAFLIGWLATVANWIWEGPLAGRRVRVVSGIYLAVITLVLVGGKVRLALFPPTTKVVRVAGITPDSTALTVEQQMLGQLPTRKQDLSGKDPAKLRAAFNMVNDQLLTNTREAAQAGAKMVVWSELAATLLPQDVPDFLAKAAALAQQERIYLLVADNVAFDSNETHLIGPHGEVLWTYHKAHPVPGLESVPPGDGRVPVVQTRYGRLANVICYDADFPGMMGAAADIMLVPGNDWPQIGRVHTQMASLRAVENGYSLFRQDFNGASAAFDYQGHVLGAQDTTTFGQHRMIVDVPTSGARTIYRITGDVFAWLCVAATVILIGIGLGRRDGTHLDRTALAESPEAGPNGDAA